MSQCTKCNKSIGGISDGDWETYKGKKYCEICLSKVKGKEEPSSSSKKEVTRITIGSVLCWIFGLIFIMCSFGVFALGSWIVGLSLILIGCFLIPPIEKRIKDKWNFEFSTGIKVVLVIIGLCMFSCVGVSNETSSTTTDFKETTTDTINEVNERVSDSVNEIADTVKTTQVSKPKERSATLTIDRVTVQLANLQPTRVTVANTGDVTIQPKFDIYVYDSDGNTVCSGSPIIDEFNSISSGNKKTGEFTLMGCMFQSDGTYDIKIDLLDSDYTLFDSASDQFDVNYWGMFDIG